MSLVRLIAVSALLVAVPATPALFAQGGPKARSGDRMVCKARAKTGTRFPSRTCRSASEWAEMEEQHKRSAAEMLGPAVTNMDPRTADIPK